MEEKIIFSNEWKYQSKKYLLNFVETTSINKLEKMMEEKEIEPRAIKIAAVYSLINDLNINRYKHPNLFNELNKINNDLNEVNQLYSIKNNYFEKDFFDFYKQAYKNNEVNKEIFKTFNSLFVKVNKKKTNMELKESIRAKVDEFMKNEKISYNYLSKKIIDNEIDVSNLHRFVHNKEYDKISIKKLLILRNKVEL